MKGGGLALTSKKSTPDAATRAGLRFLAQTDLWVLATQFLEYRDLTDGFHRPICRWIQTSPFDKNLVLLPRGHFKTSILTIAWNIQRVLNNGQVRILIASNKLEASAKMLNEIKGHLSAPRLIWLFPDVLYGDPGREAEEWTKTSVTVKRRRRTKEPTIETIGVSGELTSAHYDHITFDDIVGLENSQTREELLKTREWWQAAQPLLEPGATQEIIGTTWHYDDVYAWLQKQRAAQGMKLGVYKVACWREDTDGTPVSLSGWSRVTPTFPERFSVSARMDRRAAEGPSRCAAQYLLDPVSADTAVFPRARARVLARSEIPPLDTLWCAMTVDPAISVRAWADFTAIAVGGFAADGTLYILDLKRGRWPEHRSLEEIYAAYRAVPHIRAVGIERTGFQKLYQRLLIVEGEKRGLMLPIVGLERDTKITKQIRIRALEPYWTAGQLVLADDLVALEDFLDEAERFRLDRESSHDDLLDAVVDLLQLRATPGLRAEVDTGEDAEITDRQRLASRIQAERIAAGLAPLDDSSLRVARIHRRIVDQQELMRAELALAAGQDEFWL